MSESEREPERVMFMSKDAPSAQRGEVFNPCHCAAFDGEEHTYGEGECVSYAIDRLIDPRVEYAIHPETCPHPRSDRSDGSTCPDCLTVFIIEAD